MSLILPRRRPQGSPIGGKIALNRAHPLYGAVQFAWTARAGIGLNDLTGRARLTQPSAAVIATAGGITGIRHTATSANLSYVVPSERLSAFTGDVTFIWRGVLLGNSSGSYPSFIGLWYGDASGSPFATAVMTRGSSGGDTVGIASNSGGSFIEASRSSALSSNYNIPCTVVGSNLSGSTAARFAVCFDNGVESFGNATLSGTPATPRATTTNNQIAIGGFPADTARHINGITESALILNWATADAEDLLWIARDANAFFKMVGGAAAALSLLEAATAPEIAVTGNSNNITDGDGAPSATDHTDFGTTPEGTTKSRSYTITNDGDADLIISSVALSGAGAGEFTITANPTGTIAPAGTGTLVVTALATTQGTFTATLTINSNDGDEAAFNFDLAVEVTEPVADEGGGGALFGTLGSVSMAPRFRRKGKGFF